MESLKVMDQLENGIYMVQYSPHISTLLETHRSQSETEKQEQNRVPIWGEYGHVEIWSSAYGPKGQ